MPPLSHPQAQFVPISPELDLPALVEAASNFDYVTRLPKEMLKEHSAQSLEQLILLHVVIGGKPLVIEGWEDHLDPYLFSPEWLQSNMDKTEQRVRDIPSGQDVPMTMGHYLRSMQQLTNQFTVNNYRNSKRQRLYLKDIDVPEEWAKDLEALIPETFYYLNDCIENRTGGNGAIREPNEYGQMVFGKGVAPAGDLMSSLPEEMRAMNMMCYIGHEGTYTPAHREMCASLGHNVMVETSTDGQGQKAGSSLWFMTETKEREVVSEYFLSMLGHDIEVEKHFAQINAWKKAPFNVWIVEQRLGDLILIPPLAPHQVWNRGTRTMKAAWNRTTVDTLELALHEALPRARLVCRDEQYKNKAIIYYTLIKYYNLLLRDTIEPQMWKQGRVKQTLEDFKRLFALYQEVLVSEMFAAAQPEKNAEMLPFDSNVTCSYCRCNIFNRFLTCRNCIEGDVDTYDICMECFAMGRSCACISNLSWVEQWEWSELTQNYERWRQLLVKCDGFFDAQKSPQPLEIARKRYGRKPVAHVCQEQLKLRPYKDINSGAIVEPEASESEPEVDDHGRVKKKKGGGTRGRHVKILAGKTHACHVCCHQEYNWKLAFCTTCTQAYCYGVLWRAFDLMPQEVMEDRDWSCPKCQGFCSCGKCRKRADQQPYKPKGTLLGHDTRKVADVRSVESLVDLSKTNLTWLRGEGDDNPQESTRMKKLKEKAEAAKAQEDVIDESYLDTGNHEYNEFDPSNDADNHQLDIDPQLLEVGGGPEPSNGDHGNGHTAGHSEPFNEDWMNDDNFGISFDEFIPESANNPPKFTAPIAPMIVQEQAVGEEPVVVAAGRMMGGGYYQQESNGADKILYDAPTAEVASDHNANTADLPTPAGMKLSDLLPNPQEEVSKKKRKNSDEDDTEFFTNKKQKKAVAKRKEVEIQKRIAGQLILDDDSSDDQDASMPKKHLPGREIQKPQTYVDVGEEAMPYTEDDIVEPRPRTNDDDAMQLVVLAIKQMNKNGDEHPQQLEKKRRNRRPRDANEDAVPSLMNALPKKKERKSMWLARKEAEERGEESRPESEQPRRKRRSRGTRDSSEPSADLGISPGSKEGYGEGIERRANENSPSSSDPFASEHSAAEEEFRPATVPNRRGRPPKSRPSGSIHDEVASISGDGGTAAYKSAAGKPRKSDEAPKPRERPLRSSLPYPVETFELNEKVPQTTPKRRGRPPKITAADHSISAPKPRGPTQMLSLEEKLKLKGKTFKIVAGKSAKSNSSAPQTNLNDAKEKEGLLQVQVESRNTSNGDAELVSPDEDDYDMSRNFNNGTSAPEYTATGSTVIRKGEGYSLSSSPEPTAYVQKKKSNTGPTVIRKDDDDLYSATPEPQERPTAKPVRAPGQPSLFKRADDDTVLVSKGPTIVRLDSPQSDESSHYSSSGETIMLPKPAPAARSRVTGMVARRGRGRISFH